MTIPFEEFAAWCTERAEKKGVDVRVISLTGTGRLSLTFSYARAVCFMFRPNSAERVVLHLTWRGVVFFSPWIALATSLFGKQVFVRKFAGDFDHRFEDATKLTKKIVDIGFRNANRVFFETRYLVSWGKARNYRTNWWPNSRKLNTSVTGESRKSSKIYHLVFVGRISPDKGIGKLIEWARRCPRTVDITLYGPVDDKSLHAGMMAYEGGNLRYGGISPPGKVPSIMADSDALLLPTSWRSEGYPGVIIEAANVGVPTIASNSRGPSELIAMLGEGWTVDFDVKESVDVVLKELRVFLDNARGRALRQRATVFDSDKVFESVYSEIVGEGC